MGIIRENKSFLLPFFIISLALSVVLLLWSKSEIHLFINQFHSGFFDAFFSLWTNMGDGVVPVIFGVIFILFVSFRWAFVMLSSGLLSGIFAQFLKRVFFYDQPRPLKFFENIDTLHLVKGVKMHFWHSFPSGHTTTAFSVFLVLAFMVSKPWIKFTFLLLAYLTGFSRIYLSQHFLIDVYAGSILGVLSSLLIMLLFQNLHKSWADKSLYKIYLSGSKK